MRQSRGVLPASHSSAALRAGSSSAASGVAGGELEAPQEPRVACPGRSAAGPNGQATGMDGTAGEPPLSLANQQQVRQSLQQQQQQQQQRRKKKIPRTEKWQSVKEQQQQKQQKQGKQQKEEEKEQQQQQQQQQQQSERRQQALVIRNVGVVTSGEELDWYLEDLESKGQLQRFVEEYNFAPVS